MINLIFCGNLKVKNGILLCLLSMIKHTESPLNVYIFTADIRELDKNYIPITQRDIKEIEKIIKSKNILSKVTLITLGKEFNDWIISSKNKLSFYTPYTFLRLFSVKISVLPDKFIYLDTDIMINGDIKNLFDIDISNYELAVVLDRYGKKFIKHNYFNSGMLLINKKMVMETNLFEKVKELCVNKKMAFPDQTALNKCAKKVLYLPRKFNEQGKIKNNTVVHHFCKRIKWLPFFHTINIKPWQIELVHKKYKIHNYDDIYNEFKNILIEN